MWRVIVGAVIGFAVFDRIAAATGSVRGEAGLVVAPVVILTLLVLDRLLFKHPLRASFVTLPLRAPDGRGMYAALAVSAALLLGYPLYAWLTGARLTLHSGWPLLLPGLIAQAGIAEELLFRGFVYGRLRDVYPFWRAALLSLIPFVAAHLILFATMPPLIAGTAVLLSAVISFPLARLYDLGGHTIWAPALVHTVIQGSIKLVDVDAAHQTSLALAWMGACLVVPWLVFAVPRLPGGLKHLAPSPAPA